MNNKIAALIKEVLEYVCEDKVDIKDIYNTITGTVLLFEVDDVNIYYKVETEKTTVRYEGREWQFNKFTSSLDLVKSLL